MVIQNIIEMQRHNEMNLIEIFSLYVLYTCKWNSNDLRLARVLQGTPRLRLLLLLLLLLVHMEQLNSLYILRPTFNTPSYQNCLRKRACRVSIYVIIQHVVQHTDGAVS